ncbi:MAG: hypothetical protein IPJ52_09375 [Rhodocyclaceae bacterium]|nr:hypothetical protein [Rhodocyclaceae bacterium]
MANFVMADWHDVTAGHILKALKLMASQDAAAQEVLDRFGDSGGTVGTFATKDLQQDQLRPLLEALEKELGIAGNVSGQVGVMAALQLALKGRMSEAWTSFKPSKAAKFPVAAARALTTCTRPKTRYSASQRGSRPKRKAPRICRPERSLANRSSTTTSTRHGCR